MLNPGPALVEPSVTNESDPNYEVYWDFCEFTYNSFQLFVNITYVDFVSLPIALQLENTSGLVTTVAGTPSNGLDSVCSALTAQSAVDGAGWKDLIVKDPATGANLRAISPNAGIVMNNALFNGYFQAYVDQVWAKYATTSLQVDTQASYGVVSGKVDSSSNLAFGDAGSFPQPSAADIFSCSTGAFAVGTDEMANIAARLAAAFNRSTLLINSNQPDGEVVSTYYADPVTNHYARIVHAVSKTGYAFPYDDVGPSEGADQSGSLFDPNPKLLTVTVGGLSSTASAPVSARDHAVRQGQRPAGRRSYPGPLVARRDPEGEGEGEKRTLAQSEPAYSAKSSGGGGSSSNDDVSEGVDLETGLGPRGGKQDSFSDDVKSLLFPFSPRGNSGNKAHAELPSSSSSLTSRSLTSFVPRRWADAVASALGRLERRSNPPAVYAGAKPAVDLVVRLVTVFLSMSVGTFVSRVMMGVLLVLFYLFAPAARGSAAGGGDSGILVGQAVSSAADEVGMVTARPIGFTSVLTPE